MKNNVSHRFQLLSGMGTRMGRKWTFNLVIVSLLATTTLVGAQQNAASSLQQVNQLMNSGKQAEALQMLDVLLKSNPRDPQLRFAHGVALSSLGRADDAIAVFESLATEFPDLPEPYNNLAVLYAAKGNYDQARIKLEMAIRTNPTYATAHDNLGDVYTKLAGQSYEKALQIDSGNPVLQSKLKLLNQMVSGTTSNTIPTAPVENVVVPPIEPTPRMPTPDTSTAQIAQLPGVESSPQLAFNSDVSNGASTNGGSPLAMVKAWANAWSEQNVPQYLSFYGSNFKAPGGNRSVWEIERRNRIMGKSKITVSIYDPKVKMLGNRAIVTFNQGYRSPSFSSTTRKTLVLENSANGWKIVEERSN